MDQKMVDIPFEEDCLNLNEKYDIEDGNTCVITNSKGETYDLSKGGKIKGLHLQIHGKNNFVRFKLPLKFLNSAINIDSQNAIVDIDSCNTWGLSNLFVRIMYGEKQILKIGSDTTIAGAEINLDENSGLIIGNDCMFGGNILILPSDGHSILDCESGKIINRVQGNIAIGDHCWIGAKTILTKKAKLSNNSIVAAGSVVTRAITEENIIIAGNPAKIVKQNINWERVNPFFNKKGELE